MVIEVHLETDHNLLANQAVPYSPLNLGMHSSCFSKNKLDRMWARPSPQFPHSVLFARREFALGSRERRWPQDGFFCERSRQFLLGCLWCLKFPPLLFCGPGFQRVCPILPYISFCWAEGCEGLSTEWGNGTMWDWNRRSKFRAYTYHGDPVGQWGHH